MKIVRSFLVVLYGALITYAAIFAIGLGNAFSGWGDGSANSVRHTSFWCSWPTAVFYLAVALLPFLQRVQFKRLLLWASCCLLFADILVLGLGDGVFLFILCLVSLLPIIFLVFSKPSGPPPYAKP